MNSTKFWPLKQANTTQQPETCKQQQQQQLRLDYNKK